VSLCLLLVLAACGRGDDDTTDTSPTARPSASSTTASTPTPTPPEPDETADPAAPPIDYGNGGGVVSGSDDTSALAGAPADFRSFIGDEVGRLRAEAGDRCRNDPQIRVDKVQAGGWAAGGVTTPECGGYAVLWARTGSQWSQVWSGQQLVDCGTLMRFDFPVSVVGDQCLGQNGSAFPYRG
jgi:hypothetical protein